MSETTNENLPFSDEEIDELSPDQASRIVGKLRSRYLCVPQWWTKKHVEKNLEREISDEAWSIFRDWFHEWSHRVVDDNLHSEFEEFDWDNPVQFVENHT